MKIFNLLDPVYLNKIGETRSRTYDTTELCLYELDGVTAPCLHVFSLTISALSHQPSKFLPVFCFTESISYAFFWSARGSNIRLNVPNLAVGMDELSIVGTHMLYLVFLGEECDDEIRLRWICGC